VVVREVFFLFAGVAARFLGAWILAAEEPLGAGQTPRPWESRRLLMEVSCAKTLVSVSCSLVPEPSGSLMPTMVGDAP